MSLKPELQFDPALPHSSSRTSAQTDCVRRPHRCARRLSRGGTLPEAMMALVIIGAAVAAAAQLVLITSRQQVRLHRRDLAQQEAANQLERAMAAPWNESPASEPQSLEASAELRALLPTARIELQTSPAAGSPPAQRLRVSVSSSDPDGLFETWATMVAWKYRDGGNP